MRLLAMRLHILLSLSLCIMPLLIYGFRLQPINAVARSATRTTSRLFQLPSMDDTVFENRPVDSPFDGQLLYLDNDLIVVDKPADKQSAPGRYDKASLAGELAALFQIPRVDRMIVHRLDYATSGVIIYARNDETLKMMHAQFRRTDRVYKRYCAVVAGQLPSMEGEIDAPLGKDLDRGGPYCKVDVSQLGKESRTLWHAHKIGRSVSFVHLTPKTGRFVAVYLFFCGIAPSNLLTQVSDATVQNSPAPSSHGMHRASHRRRPFLRS